jgi:hypothetical protein
MIAMQYSFELPADYDMTVIERRVRDNGHVFDHTPGMGVKAFLSARRGDPQTGSQVNVYAPFYLWIDQQAMVDFLCGDKFVGVTNSFGWPSVQPWLVLDVEARGRLTDARFASRAVEPMNAFDSLNSTRKIERSATDAALQRGALFAISGFDSKTWQRVRFCLWPDEISASDPHTTGYNVLHTSAPQGTELFIQ